MATILFTGFPGFLGSELLPRMLARRSEATAVCVVQPRFAEVARRRAMEIEGRTPSLAGRIRLVGGDITVPGLGIDDLDAIRRETVEVVHLAAIYDLGVTRDRAMRVNVAGTRHVLDVAAGSPALERVHYVSTCYVSGTFAGVFHEDDLDVGQRFNNAYEETKYLAEREVRARIHDGLAATIYRPSIVVGDRLTGETQKYDGPYYAIQWLLRQPRVAIMPVVGDPRRTELNVVPRDFVVDAIAHLAARQDTCGRTYALADPRPLTVHAMLGELGRATERRMVRVPVPLAVAKWGLANVPGLYRLLRIPANALDYQVHPTRYDTVHAQRDLADSGIVCPPFPSYVDALVAFMRTHPEIGATGMG